MNRLALAVCLALAGCQTGALTSSPAPLQRTVIDEKAVTLLAGSLDTIALSTSALVKAGLIVKGSPTALRIAALLDTARNAVNAAAAAQRAGSASNYTAAMLDAATAFDSLKRVLGDIA